MGLWSLVSGQLASQKDSGRYQLQIEAHESDCDAPMSLVNMTFDWLKKEWADEVDFVVWTGDNAR